MRLQLLILHTKIFTVLKIKTQHYLGYYEGQEIKKGIETIKNNQIGYIEVILFNRRSTIIRNTGWEQQNLVAYIPLGSLRMRWMKETAVDKKSKGKSGNKKVTENKNKTSMNIQCCKGQEKDWSLHWSRPSRRLLEIFV